MQINFHKIEAKSYVDGPGERTVLFMQGCPIECPGCQNRHLWPVQGGRMAPVMDVANTLAILAGRGGNITISGGEPFAQPVALGQLLYLLKTVHGIGHIIVYTGYLLWQAHSICSTMYGHDPFDYIDVLVDGPFIKALDDPLITYRGSRNQRAIDVQASRRNQRVVTLNWDHPEIVITPAGNALMPVGLASEMAELGEIHKSRMCGQTREMRNA